MRQFYRLYMRQFYKLSMCIAFYVICAFLLFLIFDMLYKIMNTNSDKFPSNSLLIVILSTATLVYTLIKSTSINNETPMFMFSPLLDKRVVHDSGEYYMKYDEIKKKYILYKDNLFKKTNLLSIDTDYIENELDLSKNVKSELDKIYSKELKIKKRKDLLYKWDGYTSTESKRDDKIHKITG